MPLQNRVTPWGEIVSRPERGLFMGNRGCLHDGNRRLVKAWARSPWVTCLLQFKGHHRTLMAPGRYTELFFLDEVTALAAGHRPCATCRRDDYNAFKTLWLAANTDLAGGMNGTIEEIDRLLHAERIDAGGKKRTYSAHLDGLPDGTMMTQGGAHEPLLLQGGFLCEWSAGGYGARHSAPSDMSVQVLTPPSVVKVLARGYRPAVHPSLGTPG